MKNYALLLIGLVSLMIGLYGIANYYFNGFEASALLFQGFGCMVIGASKMVKNK